MSYIVKNISGQRLELAPSVVMVPGEQLEFQVLSEAVIALHRNGKVSVKSSEESAKERKENAKAIEDAADKMIKDAGV